jgi:signal transduction histidine kinase
MGLSISRSIVEAHGDRLEVMSNPDGGAVFRFALSAVQGEILP